MRKPTKLEKIKLHDRADLFKSEVQGWLISASLGRMTRKSSGFSEMIADASDYINYCDAILCGDYKKAKEMQRKMDSFPREGIPEKIYNTIEELT